jgi:hypothetical protein
MVYLGPASVVHKFQDGSEVSGLLEDFHGRNHPVMSLSDMICAANIPHTSNSPPVLMVGVLSGPHTLLDLVNQGQISKPDLRPADS